jgi:hypothetical protein
MTRWKHQCGDGVCVCVFSMEHMMMSGKACINEGNGKQWN